MPSSYNAASRLRPHLAFASLLTLFAVLWIAGGASRADVLGQAVVRAVAWGMIIGYVLFARSLRPGGSGAVCAILLAAIALPVLQLVPLPPSLWQSLPGRDLLAEAALVSGQEQPWRPISISPEATVNALSSLVVPLAVFLLVSRFSREEHSRLLAALLALVAASSLVAIAQFAGGRFDNPFTNDVLGSVSGTFANPNHFALFAAMGCVLAPAWAFQAKVRAGWRGPVALALLFLFGMIIMATGSRMGMLLGATGIALGLFNVRSHLVAELKRLPTKYAIGLVVAVVLAGVSTLAFSIILDRAISLDRAFALEVKEDLRRQALPVILSMTQLYFPFGSGFGAFDPVYRIHEPAELLGRAYVNHAHNDFLELVLDGGMAGLLLLMAALGWWAWKSHFAWRSHDPALVILPRAGSAMILLLMIASMTDYPVRTPMIMAMLVVAAIWLGGSKGDDQTLRARRRRGKL